MEKDKTEIEVAIEYVQRRLMSIKYAGPSAEHLINELSEALACLILARNIETQNGGEF